MSLKLYSSTFIKLKFLLFIRKELETWCKLVWWYTTIILALKRLRQEDCEFELSLDYIVNIIHLSQNKRKHNKKEAKIQNKTSKQNER